MEIYLVEAELSIKGKKETGIDTLSAKIIADGAMQAKSLMFTHIDECELTDGNQFIDGSRTSVLPAHMSSVSIGRDACEWCSKNGRMIFKT